MRICLFLAFASMTGFCADMLLPYPATRQAEVIDDYHGTKVADAYRWLEDDNSPETAAWVEAQNKVTFGFLESIPQRDAIRARLKTLWNYERFGIPHAEGGRYFFSHNSGLQNQAVLLVADAIDAEPRVLLDPNTLSTDGTVSLTGWQPSDDGNLLAYSLSRSGADWQEWHVRDVRSGRDLDDVLKWSKFSGASWAKDGGGFYYSRYDEPKPGEERKGVVEFQKLYFHKLGTPQSDDRLIYKRDDQKQWGFGGQVTDDGRWLVIPVWHGTDPRNAIFYRDLAKPDAPVVELLREFDADYSFIDNDGPVFFFQTDLDAPMRRVIAIDVTKPERANWREVIAEAPDTIEGTSLVGGRLICTYLHNARSAVRVFGLDGKPQREIALPGIGSANGFGGKRSDAATFYAFTSFTTPATIYRLDPASGESTVFKAPKADFDASEFETKQVFATSADGTRVPMFITLRRGLKLDRKQPVLLYGYGGFNISLTPGFGVMRAVWLEQGGIYVQANLRGGGEFGREWNLAGTKERKQNVFDDFIACAEWLIKNGYTSPEKLAISGGSNGGLLVGAAMTQRPDLFAAALPAVGVLDMLRFHKFTIGWAWTSDYGSADDAEQFKSLYAYSPYHHLRAGARYPATLITTGDHDDRVVPAHSFKFAARLQECQAKDGPPVLIRIETKAGHGAGTALSKTIEESADALAFLVKVLGVCDDR
ncbi:MAG: prolyl oligopeptidase family serine peptidase [Chthoniobacteraceae bacterium]